MKNKWKSAFAVLVLGLTTLSSPSEATVRFWDDGYATNSAWHHPDNWDPNGYSPSDDLIVLIGEPGAGADVVTNGSITFDGPAAVGEFDIFTDIVVAESQSAGFAILNGARVTCDNGFVGNAVGAEGLVTVTGVGSTWEHDGLYLGNNSGTGILTISDGALVSNRNSRVGYYIGSQGSAIVAGEGSAWITTGSVFRIGDEGRGMLTVSNGGRVHNNEGSIGSQDGAVGDVAVSGVGSTWQNDDYLSIGLQGTGTLSVTNGGVVSNSQHGLVGWADDAEGRVTVSGAGSRWSSSANNIYLGGGEYYTSSGGAGSGILEITDGGAVVNTNGYVGYNTGATGDVLVQGDGASWDNSGLLHVGRDGTGSLTVQNGGRVSNSIGYIGDNASATGEVIVHGSGARWENGGTLYVGREGMGTLAIQNGGAVTDQLGLIGYLDNAFGEVSVSGAGSSWNSDAYLSVGESGTGALEITSGGAVTNNDGYIGYNPTASGIAVVSGVGSTWNNRSSLYVGRDGSAELTITAGGRVANTVGYIARNNNSVADVLISGAGSTWNNSGNLYVGSFGTATLTIQDGGVVTSFESHVGDTAFGVGDVSVIGADSSWHSSGDLYVANSGHATLTIADGGYVTNNTGYVGRAMASEGHVTVRGADSTWNNNSSLSVGREGLGTLQISDGGHVSNTIGYVGYIANSSGEVTVSGAESTWSNSGNLTVGRSGVGTLTIRDGGAVTAGGLLRIAEQSTSTGTVNFEGGSLSAASVVAGGGAANFTWTGGTLSVTGGGLLLDGGLLGPVVGIHANKGLNVAGATTVNLGVTLAVTGGEFSTESLIVSGIAQVRSGRITIGDTFAVNADGQLEITGQDLALLSAPTLAGQLALDQTTLSVPSLTVATTSSVDFDSGLISSTGILYNQGVVRLGTTGAATLRALQLRNSGAVLGRGAVHAELSNQGNVGISGDSSFTEDVENLSGAKIIISGGAAATFFEDVDNQSGAEIRVSQDCTATYFGRLSGSGSHTGTGTSYIEGDLRPGSSPGIMAFGGDVVLGALSAAEFELAGLMPGSQHDQLDVAADVSLAGTLQLQPLSPYTDPTPPGTVDAFAIILAGAVEGTFDEITYDGTLLERTFSTATTVRSYQGDGLFRVLEYLADGVIYRNYRALPGDANGDGTVDGLDFILWNEHKFTSGTDWVTGDFNHDGITDGQDFILWNANKFTSVEELTAVPEPGVSLLCIGLALVLCRRR